MISEQFRQWATLLPWCRVCWTSSSMEWHVIMSLQIQSKYCGPSHDVTQPMVTTKNSMDM